MAAPRQVRLREKWGIASALGLVVAGVVVLAISLASTGRGSRNGCVDVTTAYVTGGTELYRCGTAARALCSSTGHQSGYQGAVQRAIASECSKAGIPGNR